MRWALINPADNTICQVEEFIVSTPINLNGWNWLPIFPDPVPFDPATEFKIATIQQILSDRVQETIQKRSLTADELDANKDLKISNLDAVILRIAFNHENRIRALENKQPITVDQFKTAIKSLL